MFGAQIARNYYEHRKVDQGGISNTAESNFSIVFWKLFGRIGSMYTDVHKLNDNLGSMSFSLIFRYKECMWRMLTTQMSKGVVILF